ncbi:MAG: DUF4170 domain-containing protein [Devosia sp.]
MTTAKKSAATQQLLHLVIGGEIEKAEDITFKDLAAVDLVGVYPNYAEAHAVWKQKAQLTVDNAEMRYFVVHLHRLLNPEEDGE